MRWLRTQRDLIGLVAVWGILLQSLALPFSSGLHAAAFASADADFTLICTTRGTISSKAPGIAPEDRKQSRKGAGCPCSMACHAGCANACGGGVLPTFARAALPDDKARRSASYEHSSTTKHECAIEGARAPPP